MASSSDAPASSSPAALEMVSGLDYGIPVEREEEWPPPMQGSGAPQGPGRQRQSLSETDGPMAGELVEDGALMGVDEERELPFAPGGYDEGISASEAEWPTSAEGYAINTTALTAPLIHGPSGTITIRIPWYYWTRSSGAVRYQIWVKNSQGKVFSAWYSSVQTHCPDVQGYCWVNANLPLPDGWTNMAIRAANALNVLSPWRYGKFLMAVPPAIPAAVSPNTSVNTPLPVYYWRRVANANGYQLWIRDVKGRVHSVWYSAAQAHCPTTQLDCWVKPPFPLSYNGAATWGVRASTVYNAWSPWRYQKFTVDLPPDVTPPVTTAPLAFQGAQTTGWSGAAVINEPGIGYCAAVASGAPAPTAAQVKGNSSPSKAGSRGAVAMNSGAPGVCTVTGLTPDTPYDFYFVAQDSVGNLQVDAAVSGPVTSATLPDLVPPTLTVPFGAAPLSSQTDTTWSGYAAIDEAGTGRCVAVTAGSSAPSVAEVVNDSGPNRAGVGGSVVMTANKNAFCAVTGLTPNTPYDFYFVAEDGGGNTQVSPTVSGPVSATTRIRLDDANFFPDADFRAQLQWYIARNLATHADELQAFCWNCYDNATLGAGSFPGAAALQGATYLANVTSIGLQFCDSADLTGIDTYFPNIDYLYVGNSMGTWNWTDLTNLSGLKILELDYNNIANEGAIPALPNLKTLWAYSTVNDISFVSGMTGLDDLYLETDDSTVITDISFLNNMPNLTSLALVNLPNVVDFTALASTTNLTYLEIGTSNFSDASLLAGLSALTVLQVSYNRIVDVTPLASLTGLTELYLTGNQIVDVSPLAGLTGLSFLGLVNNPIGGQGIGNVDLLAGMTNTMIRLHYNPTMSCAELQTLINGGGDVTPNAVEPGVNCTNP
ncbi:MAG: hypothetical protein HQK87_06365 [Nitrospinae bacterium]|nr:hypothetical protein [Nitrospinota bacterium]